MRIRRDDGLLITIVIFMASNISALFEYYCESLFGAFFKYIVSILVILIFGIELISASHKQNRLARAYINIQWQIVFTILYGVLYLINHQLFADNSNQPFHISGQTVLALQNVAVFLIGIYIILKASKRLLKKTVIAYFILVAIDCIFSLYYLTINDQALRMRSWQTGDSVLASMGLHGVCNTMHVYSFVTLLPIFILLIKKASKKTWPVLLFVLALITILRAGYTLAMIIAIAYCLIELIFRLTRNKVIRIIGTVLVIFVFFLADWGSVFLYLAEHVSNSSVSQRFYDLYQLLSLGQSGDALTSRVNVYSYGWEGFLKSPVWGNVLSGNRIISRHSTIIDILSDWGIIGMLLYGGLLHFLRKSVLTTANTNTRRWGGHVFMLYYFTILINVMGRYAHGTMVVAVVLPAVFLLLKTQKNASNGIAVHK